MISYDLSKIRVLIAEKQAPMRTMLRQVLREFGIKDIQDTFNPKDAFELFNQTRPDLVLTDWAPDFDGIGLITKIRTDPDSVFMQAPVIMVTAYNESNHIYQALDVGMTEYLSKPITANLLYLRIVSVIDNKRGIVRADQFTGPDRRRRNNLYGGNERRDDDDLSHATG